MCGTHSAISAYPEHEVLENTGKININRCSSPEFPPAWHDDIIEKDRAAASWVRHKAEVKQNNSCMGHGYVRGVLCSSANGKYPAMDTVFTTPGSMEVEGSTTPALNKIMEFFCTHNAGLMWYCTGLDPHDGSMLGMEFKLPGKLPERLVHRTIAA